MDASQKTAFERLVAGLSSDERNAMLLRLNTPDIKNVDFSENNKSIDNYEGTLDIRLKNESPFYKFVLWLRSFFSKESVQSIYNDDVLNNLAKKINHEHPGLVSPKSQLLDSLFYEQLLSLKSVADFFKPYFHKIEESQGAFYVFLSSFVAPQISDKINSEVDPYNLDMSDEPSGESRAVLLKLLDDILKNLPGNSRATMYEAVKGIQWLHNFVNLPFIHFIAQFTDITDNSYTCSYPAAKIDYESFAAVLDNKVVLVNEALEALFLFAQKNEITPNSYGVDMEQSVKTFMATATQKLAQIKLFLSVVPIESMGKVISSDYDWVPSRSSGPEDWYAKFRTHWRKIFDIRWTEFVRDRKKTLLSQQLASDFQLSDFPVLPNRPWAEIWGGLPFAFEMTAGLIAWYSKNRYKDNQEILNAVIMEGVFMKNDNRTEFAEALSILSQAVNNMLELLEKLEAKGFYGLKFEEFSSASSRSFNAQSKADSFITSIESEVRDISERFCKAIRTMEIIFKGIYNEISDGMHASLQNIHTLRGRGSKKFKDELADVRHDLKQMLYYISELQPIEIDASLGN